MYIAKFNLIKTNPFRFTNNEVEFPLRLGKEAYGNLNTSTLGFTDSQQEEPHCDSAGTLVKAADLRALLG